MKRQPTKRENICAPYIGKKNKIFNINLNIQEVKYPKKKKVNKSE